jgi:hypothetical protein
MFFIEAEFHTGEKPVFHYSFRTVQFIVQSSLNLLQERSKFRLTVVTRGL